MKRGIGIITYSRPKHIDLCEFQIEKYMPFEAEVITQDDSKDRKGIAYRKNECLKALKNCDYIFLFDDDCFPIKEGWADFFIMAHRLSGQHHFMYLKDTPTIKKKVEHCIVKENGWGINEYYNCGGCFMFLTKEVIEKVGGFCKDYGYYGYEHAGYSIRIHNAGLTPMGKYLCPAGASEYIYSMDYDFHRKEEFQQKVNHQPSMKAKEMMAQAEFNKHIFAKDIQTIYQPL